MAQQHMARMDSAIDLEAQYLARNWHSEVFGMTVKSMAYGG